MWRNKKVIAMSKLIVIPESDLNTIISNTIKTCFEKFYSTQVAPPETKDSLKTVNEAAEYLTISRTTLSAHSKNGLIKSYRLSGRVMYKTSELDEALRAVQTIKTGGKK